MWDGRGIPAAMAGQFQPAERVALGHRHDLGHSGGIGGHREFGLHQRGALRFGERAEFHHGAPRDLVGVPQADPLIAASPR
jgi:hypothetical protein